MCGIVGISGTGNVINNTIKALSKLEYRGYDSAGISYFNKETQSIATVKTVGKIENLESKISQILPSSNIAISHTRWSTHGEVSERNAHPHSTEKVSIVHNGIVENCDELRADLINQGVRFSSETDSEIIVQLIDQFLNTGNTPAQSVRKAISKLKGSFAVLAIFADFPSLMIAIKKDSPLTLSENQGTVFVSSDSFSISSFVEETSYLEDGDMAVIEDNHISIFDQNDQQVKRSAKKICSKVSSYEKGCFEHYMQKEIFEQPITSKYTIEHYIKNKTFTNAIPNLDINKVNKIYIIACGTSYFAGLVAKYWLETFLNISTEVEIASEFTFNPSLQDKNNISIFISQSGETADTARCLKEFKSHTLKSIGIVNVPESTIGRLVDICLPLQAGQEIGVASTKAFTSQLIVLACLTLKALEEKDPTFKSRVQSYIDSLLLLPGRISELLNHTDQYRDIADTILASRSILYIGRGASYAIASEGALKLKELSYIHAESIQAGELKHGPIALIDENVSVVAIAPDDALIHKTISNVHSILTRKGVVTLLTDTKEHGIAKQCKHSFTITSSDIFSTPVLYNIPLQLIAYYAASMSGKNVDQPRNLAKSVTVE